MSNEKRLRVIGLLVLMVATICPSGVNAALPDTTVRIEPADVSVGPNEIFVAQVVIEGAEDVVAFQFELIYVPSILQVTEATVGDFLGSTGRSVMPVGPKMDNEQGRVTLGAVSFGDAAGPSGAGVLATITYAARGEGSSPLQLLDVLVLDSQGQAQPVTIENGQVQVKGAATATSTATPAPSPTATLRPTSTPTPATAVPPLPTPTATSLVLSVSEGTVVAETPTQTPPPSPTPSPTSPAEETPTRTPPPTLTPSPSTAATEIRPTGTPTPPATPTPNGTKTRFPVTPTPTSPPPTLLPPPSPTPTPSATPTPSPTPAAALVTATANGSWHWIVLTGLLSGLGLIMLGIVVLRRRPAEADGS